MAVVIKSFRWEAAHKLPQHFGKCARLHGHSYRCEIAVRGKIQDPYDGDNSSSGMVADFYHLGEVMHPILEEKLDHWYLNETLIPEIPTTTAEMIAIWIYGKLFAFTAGDDPNHPLAGCFIDWVRVYETVDGAAEVGFDEFDKWRKRAR